MKATHILYTLLVALVVSVIVLYFIKKAQAAKHQLNNTDGKTPIYPIIYGRYSPKAALLQSALGVKQDGIIDNVTMTAWQQCKPSATIRFKIENDYQLQKEIDEIDISQGN